MKRYLQSEDKSTYPTQTKASRRGERGWREIERRRERREREVEEREQKEREREREREGGGRGRKSRKRRETDRGKADTHSALCWTYFTWPLKFTTTTINCVSQGKDIPVNMGIFVSNESKTSRFVGVRVDFQLENISERKINV